jgi:peptidoglycan lytic transglycosylase
MRHGRGLTSALASPRTAVAFLLFLPLLSTACSAHRHPASSPGAVDGPVQRGLASWYGPSFHGHRTASGERYDMRGMTAAHPTLPFGTLVEVRNLESGRQVTVRINDRGPFGKHRIIDLSYAAARQLGMVAPGTLPVELYLAAAGGAPPRYTVQLGAFSEPDRAVALHHEVARIYPEAFVQADGTWNRVQVGLFQDRDQAESLRRELAVIGLPAVVVTAK